MRPTYESARDLSREMEVGGALSTRWRVEVRKLPVSYGADFALFRGFKAVAWAEIKTRRCPSTRYETYSIALRKVMSGLHLSQATGLPFVLIVQWPDFLGYRIVTSADDVRWGGRTDRGDNADQEPMAHIQISTFKPL